MLRYCHRDTNTERDDKDIGLWNSNEQKFPNKH